MNIAQKVFEVSRRSPERCALRFEGRSISYRRLDTLAAAMARRLASAHVRRGDRVGLLLPNGPDFVIGYLGVQRLGAIAVSVNPAFRREEVAFILEDCGACAVLTDAERCGTLAAPDVLRDCEVLAAEVAEEPGTMPGPVTDTAPDDACAILYTSGTTGFPKGATLTHQNVMTNAAAKVRHCGTRANDRLLLMVPLSHCFGQNAVMNHAFHAGATIVLVRGFDPDAVLKVVQNEQVTMFFAVPTVYALLLARGDTAGPLRSVRYYLSGAAPLPVATSRAWLEVHGLPIHQGYGLTESSPFASYNGSPRERPDSIGRPIEGVEMRVVDEDGNEVTAGEVGEIVIRGPNVMRGYWNRPEETAHAINDGWLHSGDLGWRSADGWFYLVDRLKDVINVSGFKVYPAEVELAIQEHPAIRDVVVYGIPDAIVGERVRCRISLREGATATPRELLAFCRNRLAPYKVPERIDVDDHIPRNAAGKLLRCVLRDDAVDSGGGT